MAFAPDGRTLATGGEDGNAILWDVTHPAQPSRLGPPLTGNVGALGVSSVAFTPDGRTLATGTADTTAILWDLTALYQVRDHTVERPCSTTRGGLGRGEWARYIPDPPTMTAAPPDRDAADLGPASTPVLAVRLRRNLPCAGRADRGAGVRLLRASE